MKAVADSSVLISLSAIGQHSLLLRRFPSGILIPKAVWQEVVESGQERSGAGEIASAEWISVGEVTDRSFVSLLRGDLDQGEAEAIALARQERLSIVLLDEKHARRVAQQLELQVLGTVGVLLWARRVGLIASLREQLDALQTRGGFHLSIAVVQDALRTAGENE